MMRRKQKEPAPPGRYIRTRTGSPARLVRSRLFTDADEWLYSLEFADVTTGPKWTVAALTAGGVEFLSERPVDL